MSIYRFELQVHIHNSWMNFKPFMSSRRHSFKSVYWSNQPSGSLTVAAVSKGFVRLTVVNKLFSVCNKTRQMVLSSPGFWVQLRVCITHRWETTRTLHSDTHKNQKTQITKHKSRRIRHGTRSTGHKSQDARHKTIKYTKRHVLCHCKCHFF